MTAGRLRNRLEDGVDRRGEHDDERVADLAQRLPLSMVRTCRSGQRRLAASATDVPMSPGPTIASP